MGRRSGGRWGHARRGRGPAALRGLARVVVITYLVAEGVLRDRMAKQAGDEGVEVVPGTLSDTKPWLGSSWLGRSPWSDRFP